MEAGQEAEAGFHGGGGGHGARSIHVKNGKVLGGVFRKFEETIYGKVGGLCKSWGFFCKTEKLGGIDGENNGGIGKIRLVGLLIYRARFGAVVWGILCFGELKKKNF